MKRTLWRGTAVYDDRRRTNLLMVQVSAVRSGKLLSSLNRIRELPKFFCRHFTSNLSLSRNRGVLTARNTTPNGALCARFHKLWELGYTLVRSPTGSVLPIQREKDRDEALTLCSTYVTM